MEAMENIRVVLAKNLKGRRKLLKMNQEQLAEKSGLSLTYIKNIERGVSWPSPESFEALSKGLRTTVDILLNEQSFEPEKPDSGVVSIALKKMLTVPDEVYDLALELSDPLDEVWDDIVDELLVRIEQRKISQKA